MNTNENNNRSLSTLLRDAHILLDSKIESALHEAGSNRRELRLLRKIADGSDSRRIDMHVQHVGSASATFAARGWIEYAEGAWRLTATGQSELDRLQKVAADTTATALGEGSTLQADLTTLVSNLGGSDAAREQRAERRSHRGHRGHRGGRRPNPFHFAPDGHTGGPRRGYKRPDRGHDHDHGHAQQPFAGQPGEQFERMIRDLGRGLGPLLPFLGEAMRDGFDGRGGFGPRGGRGADPRGGRDGFNGRGPRGPQRPSEGETFNDGTEPRG